MKYNVIVRSTGEVVCGNCDYKEAEQCLHELKVMDKQDGVYKKDYYAIVKEKNEND